MFIIAVSTAGTIVRGGENQIIIVVTFGLLKPDVEKLVCNGIVHVLVPAGVDPHDYQLRPSDIDLLRKADLIISTGHTSFELKIHDMIKAGELNAVLIDVLEIPGISLAKNPMTGQVNYHMPITDPVNYMLFMYNLTSILVEMDSVNRDCYYSRFLEILHDLAESILSYRYIYRGNVVLDKPELQYIVEWLGFNIVVIVEPEEEVGASPETIIKIRELASSKSISVFFVSDPPIAPSSKTLLDLSVEYSIPVVKIPDFSGETGIYHAMLLVVEELSKLNIEKTNTQKTLSQESSILGTYAELIVSFLLGLIIGLFIAIYWRRRQL